MTRRRCFRLAATVTAAVILGLGAALAAPTDGTPPPAGAASGVGAEKTLGPAATPELPPDLRKQLDAMQDIRDIRPPVSYGVDPRWWVAAAGVGLLAATVPLLAWLRRRRRRGDREVSGPPPVAPGEEALAALVGLRREAGLADKAFYFRLCEVVRGYLDRQFDVDTLEKTTEELAPVLRMLPLAAGYRDGLIGLFRHADPVRYADALATPGRREGDLELAEAVVRGAGSRSGEGAGEAEGNGAPLR